MLADEKVGCGTSTLAVLVRSPATRPSSRLLVRTRVFPGHSPQQCALSAIAAVRWTRDIRSPWHKEILQRRPRNVADRQDDDIHFTQLAASAWPNKVVNVCSWG